ncbi:MAG: autotransporter outer membrane beta-barrel domain-containing protein [Deltaproteobacteria bacterium]|nr:autotransporter outer membrane beta-barrel domain-containing protein [Deltaproteobacteria bacterium]
MSDQDKLAAADIDALDRQGNLNWSSRPPYPSSWTGITWVDVDNSGTGRAVIISVDAKDLTGSLVLSGFEHLINVAANDNMLSSIEVENNPHLRELEVMGNLLSSLDVSGNPGLEYLNASFNGLVSLNVNGNHALESLHAAFNDLHAIDVSNNPALLLLDLSFNDLAAVDLRNNPDLLELDLSYNYIADLDLSGNLRLRDLDVKANELDGLDVGNNQELQYLDASDNFLDSLDVALNPGLIYLIVSNNFISDLDLANKPNLEVLEAESNWLSSLDTSSNPNLRRLIVYDNYISALDARGNMLLEELSAWNNALDSIDIGNNSYLRLLDVSFNGLDSLDVSRNPGLLNLNVSFNDLDSLDVSHNPGLLNLNVSFNDLDSLDVRQNLALQNLEASFSSLDSLDVSQNPALLFLDVSINSLDSLDLSGNPVLEYLDVSSNELVTLSLNNNPDLAYLNVTDNPLLERLYVNGTRLSSLDLDDIPNLKILSAADNRFPLSELHGMMTSAASVHLGTQGEVDLAAIPYDPVPGAFYDLGSEASFDGTPTLFKLKLNGGDAESGRDYVISPEGILTFLERGDFRITMTNPLVHDTGVYASAASASVTTLTIAVLPSGAPVGWSGTAGPRWVPEGTADSARNWLHSSYAVRYLDGDEVTFGAAAERDVSVDASGVKPGRMTVEEDGYSFSGGRIAGSGLTLAAARGSSVRFANEISFVNGAEVREGNELEFDYGASAFPSGATSDLSIFGAGSVSKDGDGALTLAGTSGYTGATRVLKGTLGLAAGADITWSLAGGGLFLAAGAAFDFSACGTLAIPRLTVDGGSSPAVIVTGAGNAADFRGADLVWNLSRAAPDGTALLRVDGDAAVDGSTGFAVTGVPAALTMAPGDWLVLLDATGELYADGFSSLTVTAPGGHAFTVMIDPAVPSRLLAVLSSLSPMAARYARMKAYPEAAAASLAFLAEGQDVLIREGTPSAVSAAAGRGIVRGAFVALAGGRSRYETGSGVDVSGVSVLAGAATGRDLGAGRLTLGLFAEAGRGDYDTRNAFPDSPKVDGGGDASYAGGGVLARWDAAAGPLPGLYLEASARFGRREADFATDDIRHDGARASFKISGRYLGLHGGLGRTWKPGGADGSITLDLGAKILWTRQEGSGFPVNADRVSIQDSDSLRVRAGARLTYGAGGRAAPFMGVYLEREFDGAVRASANGVPLETPSLKGNTGILELGAALRPSDAVPLELQIGVRGYGGKRDGFTGSVDLKFEF